jgi:hypothetical protein
MKIVLRAFIPIESQAPNDKLTDDEERAKRDRFETETSSRSSSFGPANG